MLCEDICKRNGKTKFLWLADGNKTLNYQPKADEMVLTAHRWFANKSCPGNWIFSRMGDLAEKVTEKLGSKVEIPVDNTEKYIWDYLMKKIGNPLDVPGLIGNAESSLRSNNIQNSLEKKLGLNDETYTFTVDTGACGNFVRDGAGYGLAQWTFGAGRKHCLSSLRKRARASEIFRCNLNSSGRNLRRVICRF